ncbi:MAG: DUF169 domain-containing protein [Desulfovibrio sp.]|nr:DUF169 domain-containing protein [Desulfovibrio sp.]
MQLSYRDMEKTLMEELRLYHHPIAVTFLMSEGEVEQFTRSANYVTPVKPLTFCQWETAARMQGKTVLGTIDKLACNNAKVSFGWRDVDPDEIKTQMKYTVDRAQAERFVASKPHLPRNALAAVAVGPLGECVQEPSVVHFYCDSIQAYHLAIDYMASTDTHPLKTQLMMSSAACGGSVWSWQEQAFNFSTPCSGSYNAGKTERGESYVFIPGSQIEGVVNRLLTRIKTLGSSSITHPGDYFPGGDICKNCPLIVFKKGNESCENCSQKDSQ